MHEICHTEFNSKNPKRTAEFFTKLFGWTTEDSGSPEMEYIIWKNGEHEGGGIGSSQEPSSGCSTLVYIHVENITQTLANAKSLGGKIIQEETSIGQFGYMGILEEPGGCQIGLWAKNASK